MIMWKRKARIQAGKVQEAIGFSKEVCAVAERITGSPVHAYVQVGGNIGSICWVAESKDLAAYEQLTNKLTSDPDYLKLLQRGPSLFVPGFTEDELWRSV